MEPNANVPYVDLVYNGLIILFIYVFLLCSCLLLTCLCLLSFPALFCLIYAICFSLFASVLFYLIFLVQLSFSLHS